MPSFLFSIIFSPITQVQCFQFHKGKDWNHSVFKSTSGSCKPYLPVSRISVRHQTPAASLIDRYCQLGPHCTFSRSILFTTTAPTCICKKNINKILHIFLSYRLGCFLEHLCLWMIANTCVYSVYKNIDIHVHVYRNIGILVNSYRVILFRFLDESTGLSVCHKGL